MLLGDVCVYVCVVCVCVCVCFCVWCGVVPRGRVTQVTTVRVYEGMCVMLNMCRERERERERERTLLYMYVNACSHTSTLFKVQDTTPEPSKVREGRKGRQCAKDFPFHFLL